MGVKKSKAAIRVGLIIPAYNEANAIKMVLSDLQKKLKKEKFSAEIIVVDDGSTDATATVARQSGATVISHILNSGSGGATATGLSYAQQQNFDIAATLDADGQHNSKDVIRGIHLIQKNNADLIIGSRLIDANGMSTLKIIGNKGLSFMTYILFGINVTDSQSGLRIFSRTALEQLRWKTSGYEFCSEMLWRAKQLGLTVTEYPIEAIYTDYSKSKGQSNWNAFNIFKSLLRRRVQELFNE